MWALPSSTDLTGDRNGRERLSEDTGSESADEPDTRRGDELQPGHPEKYYLGQGPTIDLGELDGPFAGRDVVSVTDAFRETFL